MAQQKFREATIEYRNALQAQPQRAEAHYKLAQAYRLSGDLPKAYTDYAQAGDLDPSNVDAHVQAGTLLLHAGQFDDARRRAERALEADPKSVRALILLGNANAGLHETGRALQQVEQAIAIDPGVRAGVLRAGRHPAGARSDRDRARVVRESGGARSEIDRCAARAREPSLGVEGRRRGRARAENSAGDCRRETALAHRALALFYLTERRAAEAEPHFKALAAASADGSLALADYYSGTPAVRRSAGRAARASRLLKRRGTRPGSVSRPCSR